MNPEREQYDIEVVNRQRSVSVDPLPLETGVRLTLRSEGILSAQICIAVVNSSEMQQLNNRHLQHDYDTDVLSFLLSDPTDGLLEGDLVVCAEYAKHAADKFAWETASEMLLYAVHGTLHLCGYDDATDHQRAEMRIQERMILDKLGLTPTYAENST